MRVRVPQVLAEGLAVGHSDLRPATRRPATAAIEVLVQPMLLPQPIPLTGMTGQHRQLQFKRLTDVDDELGWDRLTVLVDPLDRVDIV